MGVECELMKKRHGIKSFLLALFSGIIGACIFFTLSIMVFALVKIIYMLMSKDLLLSRYNILVTVLIFMLFGFAYGISAYLRKSGYVKLFRLRWKTFFVNLVLSILFSFVAYSVMKYYYNITLGSQGILALFALLFVMFYAFSAIVGTYMSSQRAQPRGHRSRNTLLLVLMNPLFILAALVLFGMTVYNSFYVPCGISIAGVDDNIYTASTAHLEILPGEKLVSIDDIPVYSLVDVKRYINSLDASREVIVETEDNLYYVKTYIADGERFMGLLLQQDYCEKKYGE